MNLLIVCISIFLARIIDVAIGTFRTIIMVKGDITKSTILAFLEVMIWYLAARQALNTEYDSIFIAISYSLGYATGTYIGSIFSKKFIKGTTNIQVVTTKATKKNINLIKENGYGLTVINLDDDNKKMLMLEVDNKKLNDITTLLKKIDQNAFIICSETKMVVNGFLK